MILQLLIKGLSLGAVYALIAIGFSLLWQTSRTINFAQGEFVTLPAFIMVLLAFVLKIPFAIALILTIIISGFLLGYLMNRVLVRPLIEEGVLPLVVATIALGFMVRDSLIIAWTPEALHFPSLVPKIPLHLGAAAFSAVDLWNIFVATLIISGLHLFVKKTKTGKALQAVSQDREVANILGINVPKMILFAFMLNAIISAFSAILIAPIYMVKYDMGVELGLKAFYAAIIGGFNQTRGALLGGLLVGLIETFTAAYISTQYKGAFVLIILMVVILFKPEGLLGEKEIYEYR
ncbi:MAG: branched-chain amino acid ABC transporter permease [Desulfobacterales bacterium]|jgi:branched-chain amino acid transport system permease protein